MRRAALLAAALLGACGDDPAPEPPAEAASASCKKCGATAGANHICGATHWCGKCGRDAGRNHRCGETAATFFCTTCRAEGDRPIPDGTHDCGRTSLCEECVKRSDGLLHEHAPNHLHGRTRYCSTCKLDVLPGHSCKDATFPCPRCEIERLREGHECRRSAYCGQCAVEASLVEGEHRHQATMYCTACRAEKSRPHGHSGN